MACETRQQYVRKLVSVATGAIFCSQPAFAVESQRAKPEQWADIDGAIGFSFGAKERCNPSDINCGINGIPVSLKDTQRPFEQEDFPITDKFKISVGFKGNVVGSIVLGLWRDAAPKSVDLFAKMCTEYELKDDENYGVRVTYSNQKISQIVRNEKIVFADTVYPGTEKNRKTKPVVPPENADKNTKIVHGYSGLVSMRKGGGSFEFLINPRPNGRLNVDYIVIGQVLEGMDVVEQLNQAPVNKYDRSPLQKLSIVDIEKYS